MLGLWGGKCKLGLKLITPSFYAAAIQDLELLFPNQVLTDYGL